MPPTPSRRTVLGTWGALLMGSLGGCALDSNGDDRVSETTPTAPTETPTSTPTKSQPTPTGVRIRQAKVQTGYVRTGDDSLSVISNAGQYLLISVSVDRESPPANSAFEFVFDGEHYAPESEQRGSDLNLYREDVDAFDASYTPKRGQGWLVFGLPETGNPADARLTWPDGSWTPPAQIRTRLASPSPAFDVTFTVPERVEPAESPTLSITVTNTSDVAGCGVLALNLTRPVYGPVQRFAVDLEPAETRTFTYDGRNPFESDYQDPAPVRYRLITPNGNRIERTLHPSE